MGYVKPPLGVVPKFIWEEMRLNELGRAIREYMDFNLEVRLEWIEEYNELVIKVRDRDES